ncbi:up-regulated during skeletal muscle growth protein 5-like [Parambassis ranga]|uniref:Up-regulated during skeletal muscle growth protein 5-like n=1 Tax=Parambassis ranga TaxID=210632 RepID=A0A6P7IJ53_9TELE|nr:up-regulated during skeletal muscle growth protein 5-like [Parambassis ranga]XP_028264813.1 up-regulated during skeletal muscle growth protein 5-like [Parambassis ranga]
MPTSPVTTRIPLTSLGHLVTEVKKQLFGIKAPVSEELSGWRKYFNSYTMQGRRNCVLTTYGILAVTAVVLLMHRPNKNESKTSTSTEG